MPYDHAEDNEFAETLADIIRRATVLRECLTNHLIEDHDIAGLSVERVPPVVAFACYPADVDKARVTPKRFLAALVDLGRRGKDLADRYGIRIGIT